ncbi:MULTISPECIES: GPP34 family phosphoprotein [unclassified Micromonospora]|uniref:GOLPH3/VPS74 family protein n=1 Tax=unclassified Micromonospora TaxID=2617518 RepID=UPI0022B5F174|nr:MULTISPECIES: GPP34 family phosphoprotein [unclassified Micromonospora]MCZ7421344.1 GPP34 family phosphoprotein [Verrucosispora sp. WMMA2121]WBB93962.1 GPP34 family phosphoprotein [Verrucosispora sp. WMMC514]
MTAETSQPGSPTLVEDLLLLLFQPRSGTIAGENTLFYVLAGAVLADLALADRVTMADRRKVSIVEGRAPSDELLRSAWDYVSEKPRGVQTVLAAIGPELRKPVLERLIGRGDIRREDRKMLGLFRTTALRDGGTGRRARLLEEVRQVLVDGAEPSARVAALAALLSGSGTLPQFYRDIPWTTPVIKRAKELEQGNWGAGAAAEAVTRTITATVVNSVIVSTTVIPRS